jgi:hypothetical protein|nr:MAG TPA: hypothetical protein [Caudoviricetes sp.]
MILNLKYRAKSRQLPIKRSKKAVKPVNTTISRIYNSCGLV